MLVIRQAQLATLSRLAAGQFEQRMRAHVRKFFPRQCLFIGDAQVDAALRLAIERAERSGLRTCRQLCLSLSLSFLLGSHYDEDAQYPWASHAGRDAGAVDPDEHIDAVVDTTMRYLDEVHGDDNELLVRTLVRVRRLDDATLPRLSDGAGTDAAAAFLSTLSPRKAARQHDATAGLLADALALSARRGWDADTGPAIALLHAFLLGAGFARDPQFPWAADAPGGAATERAVLARSVDFIHAVLR
jgi:hypothetical protein